MKLHFDPIGRRWWFECALFSVGIKPGQYWPDRWHDARGTFARFPSGWVRRK